MTDVRVADDLWSTSMLPEGLVERWLVADGALVRAGQPLVELRVEDALHKIAAPASGTFAIVTGVNAVIEPGSLLAQLAC
jgi:pyruvate/2-oxoglutarate dehydrogenase complex dihydrolipoamide acyltransferase (E2) component